MIICLQKRVRMQPILAFYFKFENELKFYNVDARFCLCDRLIPYMYCKRGCSSVTLPDIESHSGQNEYLIGISIQPYVHIC